MKKIFYLIFLLGLSLNVMSQIRFERCMTEVIGVEEFGSLSNFYEYQKTINEQVVFRGERIIPIVVHVLWHEEAENISRLQVLSQIDALNADFSASNDAVEFLSTEFGDLSEDSGIRFCLADSLGGIERRYVEYDTVGWAIDSLGHKVLSHSQYGGLDSWDNGRYLNVWVGRMPIGSLGYYFTEFGNVAGIVIDTDVFGTIGSVVKRPRNAKGKTLTHEIGHFFGLAHIWGLGCEFDDGIDDTPLQEGPTTGCPNWPEWSCDTHDMYMNFMDYSDDVCLTMFTKGQIERMQMVLANRYPNLGLNNECINVASDFSVRVFPNPVVDYLVLQIYTESKNNEVSVYAINGQMIYHVSVASPIYLSITAKSWASGLYFLKVRNSSQVVWRRILHTSL